MSVSQADASFVRDLVLKRSAILLDEAKDYLIEMRLTQAARDHGLTDAAELVSKARSGERGADIKIIEAITTHETSFYRDLQPFEALKKELLPKLSTARAGSRSLTIWSAACSSGQEPYSIALLILEHFPALASWPVKIIATDLSEQVLNKAREARFTQMEINRGLPANLLVKYFQRVGMNWQLKESIRKLVEFRQLNLIDAWTMTPRPDIVLLRNVLIYFDIATKRAILDRIKRTIAPDGALFLGAAETTLNVTDGWERVAVDKSHFYRIKS
jgi:chemotaxis protein methyltransferase CheR